jgi:alpha-ketoglutaric semialdehyde dehydrogenase
MPTQSVLIADEWRPAQEIGTFHATNPANREPIPREFPISSWADCDAALSAAAAAAIALELLTPDVIADFLERYADRLAANAEAICASAELETALPAKPRLVEVETPRTINQLRAAAAAARDGSWRLATIDTANNIRSCYSALGPVAVFGPNNFPLAFNGISGGDFAAAIAAGNPVIAKAHPSHPHTSQLMAREAHHASREAGLPAGTVQILYKTSRQDGIRLVSDPRLGAAAFTGSRSGGLALKAAADAVGKPIYLEMSSVNPVFFLPGAVAERRADLVNELAGSCLLGTGQFCTCPNAFILFAGDAGEALIADLATQFSSRPVGTLLSSHVLEILQNAVSTLKDAGAEIAVGGRSLERPGFRFQNTLLRVSGEKFLRAAERLQTEAFGNATLAIVVDDMRQATAVAAKLEGSLTGSIYSARNGGDDKLYDQIAPILRRRVGRLLNDKMPTGVVVSPAMNHGGPFPATGHPGFTAVGIPASMRRFSMLQCYDNVRPHRLPPWLQDASPNATMWRSIDGKWTQDAVGRA